MSGQNDTERNDRHLEGHVLGDHLVFPILLTKDLTVSRAFYHDTLGLEVVREGADRIMFRCGGGSLLTLSLSTTGTADTQTQAAWRVTDLKAELADLRARGVEIQEYDAPDPKTTDGIADMGFAWAAWFVDPSRNVLGVIQPKGG
jgi:catechol 2,3-dioxygenase-like lactoylglutathione lyase family enzyme